MDLRDDVHTQLTEHIKTLRVLAKLKPPSELVMNEINRWADQSATILELYVLSTIKQSPPYLDLRTGTLGNGHKIAEYERVVGATSEAAAEADAAADVITNDTVNGFLRESRK